MTSLSYCSNLCRKAPKMDKILVEIFIKLELFKMPIMSKFDQDPITISKVMAFLSYCSNFCRKAPQMVKILDEKLWKVQIIQIDHHTKISSKSDQ